MKEYKVSFKVSGKRQQEVVKAINIFRAQKQIENKYGKEKVSVSVIASTNNIWV